MKNLKRFSMKHKIMIQNGWKHGLKNIWKDGLTRKGIEMDSIGKRHSTKE